jgi:3-phosphoshikimate 1-carboxyvinyltransferase
MIFSVKKSVLKGDAPIPGSKSHTIRALVLASLADGESEILKPLHSSDTLSCLEMIKMFGARVADIPGGWRVTGTDCAPKIPENVIDVGNSGTSLYIGMGTAALTGGAVVFTGDHQIRNRPADKLIASINDLGATAYSTRPGGKPPLVIKGRLKGGSTSVEAVTSQYLSSLLMAAPFADGDTEILVPLLYEQPYVEMTLDWLDRLGIKYANEDFRRISVPGRQRFSAFSRYVPVDFSSASFFLCAAAIAGDDVNIQGLDYTDTQGDKHIAEILKEMGASLTIKNDNTAMSARPLRGGTFDLNAMPDALPILAVTACFAEGETRLINVPQARLKETDRISVMHAELKKMGADIEELPDGLVIRKSHLKGARVNGHHDHRVVMALSVAGMNAESETVIDTAESVAVTFPEFFELMNGLGADIIRK